MIPTGRAIAALLLNIFVWPGVGSLVGSEMIGLAQISLALLGFVVGLGSQIPALTLVLPAWVWGIVTGVRLILRSKEREPGEAPMDDAAS